MTPAYLRALQAAILADANCQPHVHTNDMPKIPGAEAAAKDAAIAGILNGKAWGAASRPVPAWQAKKWLIKRGKWRAIVLAANNDQHPAVDAAYAAVALAEDARMDADFLDPAADPMLDALVASGLIDAQDRAGLEAMCRTASAVTASEVSRALRGPWGDE